MAKGKVGYWLTPEGLTLLEGWARDGLTDEQIAHNCGLKNRKTIYDWKNKYSNISDALKKGKEIADYEIENALYKRAKGYSYVEKTYECGKLKKEVTKEIAPDTTAIIYWLNNRKPKNWKNKQHIQEDENENKRAKDILAKIRKVAND